jgi:hypothetical protein
LLVDQILFRIWHFRMRNAQDIYIYPRQCLTISSSKAECLLFEGEDNAWTESTQRIVGCTTLQDADVAGYTRGSMHLDRFMPHVSKREFVPRHRFAFHLQVPVSCKRIRQCKVMVLLGNSVLSDIHGYPVPHQILFEIGWD